MLSPGMEEGTDQLEASGVEELTIEETAIGVELATETCLFSAAIWVFEQLVVEVRTDVDVPQDVVHDTEFPYTEVDVTLTLSTEAVPLDQVEELDAIANVWDTTLEEAGAGTDVEATQDGCHEDPEEL